MALTLSPRPRIPARRAPSSPLVSAPVLMPAVNESEWSDDSDSEAGPSTPVTPRRVRGRHMHIRDPRAAGLYTLCEGDEDDESTQQSTIKLTKPKQRPTLSSFPPSTLASTCRTAIVHTPGEENEDPFALDDLCNDEPAPTPAPAPALTRTAPPTLTLSPAKSARSRKAPPTPLELAAPDCPISALRYPVSPHRLDFSLPNTPLFPPRPPHSPVRPARVSSSTALPRTPTVASMGLFPNAPVFPADVWEVRNSRNSRSPRASLSPEPQTPVTPTTPALDRDVNMVSALRELLASCGEFDDLIQDDLLDEDVFDDSEEDPSTPVVPRSASLSGPATPPQEPFRSQPPVRSNSTPVVSAAPRPRSRSLLPRPEDRPVGLFGHHAYLRSLSTDDVAGSVDVPTLVTTSPLMVDKPLPLLEVREPSDMDDSDIEEDDDDTISIHSSSSSPGLSYSSSATSISSTVTSSSFVYTTAPSVLYSLGNTTSSALASKESALRAKMDEEVPPLPSRLGRNLKFWH